MTTTVSKVLFGKTHDCELLRKWCDEAAIQGGTFSINQEIFAGDWYCVYTINWPERGLADKPKGE